eukprot:6703547-Pyramimonas_sp.AAC.1
MERARAQAGSVSSDGAAHRADRAQQCGCGLPRGRPQRHRAARALARFSCLGSSSGASRRLRPRPRLRCQQLLLRRVKP